MSITRLLRAKLAGVLVLGSTVLGMAQEPGVTDDEIVIGMFAPLSGPLTAFGADALAAAQAYYEEVNKNGGIHGRKIRVVVEDDKCDPNETNAVARKLVGGSNVFMLNGGSCTAAIVSLQEYVTREKIPYVVLNGSGDGAIVPPTRYVFGGFPGTQRTIGAAITQFAAGHLEAKKIYYLSSDDDYGRSNAGAARSIAERENVTFENAFVPPNVNDMTSIVLAVRQSDPDVIVSALYPAPTVLLVRKLAEFGIDKPIVQGIQGVPVPETFVRNVDNTDALSNFFYSSPLNDLVDGPKQQPWLDLFEQYNPGKKPSGFMAYGFPSAMAVVKGLEGAGRELTREGFIDALEQVSFESEVMAGPIVFGPDRRDGLRDQVIYKFDGNTHELMPGIYSSSDE